MVPICEIPSWGCEVVVTSVGRNRDWKVTLVTESGKLKEYNIGHEPDIENGIITAGAKIYQESLRAGVGEEFNIGGESYYVKDIVGELVEDGLQLIIDATEDLEFNQFALECVGVDELYHITALNNVPNILEYGLLPRERVLGRGLLEDDISDPSIQDRRKRRYLRGYNLHCWTPLFFNPRNPMLRRKLNPQADDYYDQVVILGIDASIMLDRHRVVYTDGNAVSPDTSFYEGLLCIEDLPWDRIRHRLNRYKRVRTSSDYELSRIMQAEILVRPLIPPDRINTLYCRNRKHGRIAKRKISEFEWVNLSLERDIFF